MFATPTPIYIASSSSSSSSSGGVSRISMKFSNEGSLTFPWDCNVLLTAFPFESLTESSHLSQYTQSRVGLESRVSRANTQLYRNL